MVNPGGINFSSGGFRVHNLVFLSRITNHRPPYSTADCQTLSVIGVRLVAVRGKKVNNKNPPDGNRSMIQKSKGSLPPKPNFKEF
jgi:hypothetical protein